MTRFLLGDELGHIKSLRYTQDVSQEKYSLSVVHDASQRHAAVQRLAISSSENEQTIVRISTFSIKCGLSHGPQVKLTAAFSDGAISAFHLHENDTLQTLSTWNEPRLKEKQKIVGLSASARYAMFFLFVSDGWRELR
jgi:ribosome biogenesis protein NSA1